MIVKQLNFAAGEICPALYARTDQQKYSTGLRTMRNVFVMRHGGGSNRPGTKFIGETRAPEGRVRLIPFIFDADQTYVLEFSHLAMRVVKDGGYLTQTPQAITGISNANPAVVTYTGSDTYTAGEDVFITGILGGMGQYLNGRNLKVGTVDTGANTFTLKYLDGTAVDSTAFGSYTSGGTVAELYQITTPYEEEDLSTLQYVQSADVVTIAHQDYPPAQLARTADTSWTLTNISFAPGIDAPTGVAVSGAGGSVDNWVVTAIAQETYQESLPSSSVGASALATGVAPRTITWNAVTGAQEYNVYKLKNGVYGFIGIAGSTTFVDTGVDADTSDTPPITRNPFSGVNNYPATVNYIQERLSFANTRTFPETVWMSRSGFYQNFTISSPIQDDDAVTFTMSGRQVNKVRHLLDLGAFLVLTNGGEHTIQGDAAGIIKPGEINRKQNTYNGSSELAPLVIGGTALYLQARGTIIRDLAYQYESEGYRGNDVTIFSAHLFDGYSIVDWAYQQTPHSVVWAVRSDGVLLALTYIREQALAGWSRHDFQGGLVENVCVVPEGLEDAVYVTVRRDINGLSNLYLERLNTRFVDDIKDSVFMDSALTYDGRNTNNTHTMTLTGGTTWDHTEILTITSSSSFFTPDDVGNAIHFELVDGTVLRVKIRGYTSGTVVTGRANKIVPLSLRSTASSVWAKGVDEVRGLWHLEGQNVSVFGDGFVVASPYNDSYEVHTVEDGSVSFQETYTVLHVGLPYISDIETLDMDTNQSETLVNKKKLVNAVWLEMEKTRGIFAGTKPPTSDVEDPLEGLYELKLREEEGYDDAVDLLTGKKKVELSSSWNNNGRIFLRQIDPLPMSILSISPEGLIPFKG